MIYINHCDNVGHLNAVYYVRSADEMLRTICRQHASILYSL